MSAKCSDATLTTENIEPHSKDPEYVYWISSIQKYTSSVFGAA